AGVDRRQPGRGGGGGGMVGAAAGSGGLLLSGSGACGMGPLATLGRPAAGTRWPGSTGRVRGLRRCLPVGRTAADAVRTGGADRRTADPVLGPASADPCLGGTLSGNRAA